MTRKSISEDKYEPCDNSYPPEIDNHDKVLFTMLGWQGKTRWASHTREIEMELVGSMMRNVRMETFTMDRSTTIVDVSIKLDGQRITQRINQSPVCLIAGQDLAFHPGSIVVNIQ